MASFTEQLMQAKRRAQLSGRPLTSQEVSGISAGAADSASARLARAKSVSLQEARDVTQAGQFTESLAAQESRFARSAGTQAEQFAKTAETTESRYARELDFQKRQAEEKQAILREQMKAKEEAEARALVIQREQMKAKEEAEARALVLRREENAANEALKREAMEAQEQAAMYGTVGNVATTAATLYALKGGLGAATAPVAGGAAGAGMSGLAGAGYAAGILAAEELTSPYIEEQAGTSVKHGTSIAAHAGAGAVAGSVVPVVGTAIGAVVGGAIGIVREASGSVICSELHKQGILSDELYAADANFGKKQDIDVIMGYHFWAKPLARMMARSPLVTTLVKPIALSWANHMAHIEGIREKPSVVGKIIHNIGFPVCRFIGRMKHQWRYNHG